MTDSTIAHPATTFPTGLGAIADGLELVVMDLWGCMHDGVRVYPAALDALRRLKERGIAVALVSNAPRRIARVVPRLEEMGIGADLYAGIYTSGEMIWRHLAIRAEAAYRALGRRALAIGAVEDRGYFGGTDCAFTDDIEMADFTIVFGVADESVRVADFDSLLARALARGLPMICANPDLIVHRGGIEEICAGAIAEEYRRRGGTILIEGKPYPGIYRRVMADLGISDPACVLGIGDALRTDVAGAAGIGARSLLIAGGIHHGELLRDGAIDRAALARITAGAPSPTHALPYLVW
ncbi:HAD superfamily hydrolase (TIGR01459 family) [Dongia mobilis]|uniref:HAD superfamily hydrolase (TIGR01459 family) n=1 Tax=Dongia mobilis TaxID=578943 RepID=A0A4R6WM67_9PROT|nr:TIGR01459 family HAD-type hydrolase [Dongia mobilis]TDQ82079.1 HAD superfamily hydrolase (TIGR01459 family) [Dongia mobilis]